MAASSPWRLWSWSKCRKTEILMLPGAARSPPFAEIAEASGAAPAAGGAMLKWGTTTSKMPA